MGPLIGTKIIEFAGIGPGPFAGMMLADMGADVLRIDRPGPPAPGRSSDVLARGRRSVVLDLKSESGRIAALKLCAKADALIEGFRPGVMERLGLGPEACHAVNPALVYGRMTGWGQDGPLAQAAGHDLNYIALSGALWATGEADRAPVPALNLLGDFGGGGMMLAFGIVCGLVRARETGKGDVIDAAIVDGTAALMGFIGGLRAQGRWQNERASNFLDGAAPYYGVYRCADGKWITLGALEPQFFDILIRKLNLPPDWQKGRHDKANWPEYRARLEELFASRSRDDWCAEFEGTDVCFGPVLDLDEAPEHPHNRARGIFRDVGGVVQPAPAPRFRDAAPEMPTPAPMPGEGQAAVLVDWGLDPEEFADIAEDRV